jgi:hypothetical protein
MLDFLGKFCKQQNIKFIATANTENVREKVKDITGNLVTDIKTQNLDSLFKTIFGEEYTKLKESLDKPITGDEVVILAKAG